jgi:hypothetical protein
MTQVDSSGAGIVVDWADQRRLDTRAMHWEDLPGDPESKIKVLSRDDRGNVRVCLLWSPPREAASGDSPTRRRIHTGARQLTLVLAGEQAGLEYANADAPGEPVVYREGFFIDRSPGSIYEVETSTVGSTSLIWRTDDGNVPAETEAAVGAATSPEGPRVASADHEPSTADDGVVVDRDTLRVLDTRQMPWQGFAGLRRGKVKVLTSDEHGNPTAFMVWIPPGEVVEGWALPHRHYHRSIREFSFMISGELPHWEYQNAEQQVGDLVIVRPMYFLDRSPGSIHGLEPGPTSPTGCILLQWRQGVGNWVNEPEFASETIEVPYADNGH